MILLERGGWNREIYFTKYNFKATMNCLTSRLSLIFLLAVYHIQLIAQEVVPAHIELARDSSGVSVLTFANNKEKARNYIDSNGVLGTINLKYQAGDGKEVDISTSLLRPTLVFEVANQIKLSYNLADKLIVTETFKIIYDALFWNISLTNLSASQIVIKDLSVLLPFGKFSKSMPVNENLSTHSAVIGNASFCYWIPYNGAGNILVMTMLGSTSLEFNNRRSDEVYIHASTSIDTKNDSWPIPATTMTVSKYDTKSYGFKFEIAESIDEIRNILYNDSGLDTRIVPGMTVPSNLSVICAIRSKSPINKLTAEYPKQTEITYIGPAPLKYNLYRLRFKKLGENKVTVEYDKSKKAYLNFFSTEPLEVLIKKRASFITYQQQVRDTSKWYNGLYSIWDMEKSKLLTPDDQGALPSFVVGGSDDPSNCKPLYISEKNVIYPDRKEIAALEYYEKKFVWGGLQRRSDEYPYPYGIYGSDNWFENRSGKVAGYNSGGWGKERMWRTFDYTTHFAIYYNLYRIAVNDPSSVTYLDARGYLERAYRTAMAFFEVPYNIKMGEKWSFHGWSDWAYKQGNFHERYIVDIIQALIENKRNEEADLLRREWEKKVKYFVYDDPWPFASEFEIDRTAFESTYYVAEYAKEHVMEPQEQLWYDKNKGIWYSHTAISDSLNDVLMKKQLNANLALRGVLEPSFNLLGTGWVTQFSLDYMSQMGGVAILDYGLKFADQPYKYINIGYNSILSSWALMNTGTQESNYGYWYPGKQNDGAIGWVFSPWQNTTTYFSNIPVKRQAWKYDGEIDHGLVGAIHGTSAIVIDDPVFGLTGYGCEINYGGNSKSIYVIPKDGVRQQLHVLTKNNRFSIKFEKDGFLRDSPVIYKDDLKMISFSIENRQDKPHQCLIWVSILTVAKYEVYVDKKLINTLTVNEHKGNKTLLLKVPVDNAETKVVIKSTK